MSMSNPNLPKSILALRAYTREVFVHDALAGITVGLVALPLAMAFGIASGVTPQAGLYTAVVAGFLISALGGSRFVDHMGRENIMANIQTALDRAKEVYEARSAA